MKFHHVTWRSFAAALYVTHALCVASSARSLSIVPWTLFQPWTLYQPWTPWRTHFEKLHHVTWRSFAAAPHVTHALRVASSARSFSIVPWTLFWPWTLYQPWTPWRTHFGSSTPCDAHTACGELRSLFFFCTVNSFLIINSLPTLSSMKHTLI